MNKIDTSTNDFQWHGLGYNYFNFCRNANLKLSNWLIATHSEMFHMSYEEEKELASKLKRIIEIINED